MNGRGWTGARIPGQAHHRRRKSYNECHSFLIRRRDDFAEITADLERLIEFTYWS